MSDQKQDQAPMGQMVLMAILLLSVVVLFLTLLWSALKSPERNLSGYNETGHQSFKAQTTKEVISEFHTAKKNRIFKTQITDEVDNNFSVVHAILDNDRVIEMRAFKRNRKHNCFG